LDLLHDLDLLECELLELFVDNELDFLLFRFLVDFLSDFDFVVDLDFVFTVFLFIVDVMSLVCDEDGVDFSSLFIV
jgi:hypothetical protein